jgi:3'-phosphoadenosine 5'-phosphosulfate sulfotransferase (PAPS reductase)/FAD synthetase
MIPNLVLYDHILVNSSAGKDSQCMLDVVCEAARDAGVDDRITVVHADLGREEWPGTKELARHQAEHYGLRFEVVRRKGGGLLDRVRERGKWPDAARRWCTSDLKRSPVRTLMTRLATETRARFPGGHTWILNCMGMRAQESPARGKLPAFARDARASNGRREVHTWLPIHGWNTQQVWGRIFASGVPYHHAYELGMPRLSCRFCIFANRAGLLLAGKHSPELLADYVRAEQEIGHSFRNNLKLAEIKDAIDRGEEPGTIPEWEM